MKALRRHRPSPATAIALGALIVALGGVAFASIPDSSGTIHACFQQTNGQLRVVESDASCRKSERALSWNQIGPTGPTGPTGGAAEGARTLTQGGTVAPGDTMALLEIPGVVRITLRCPGPDDFAGGVKHYNYRAENLDPNDAIWVEGIPAQTSYIPAGSSVNPITTIEHGAGDLAVFGGGMVANGGMTLFQQPSSNARQTACVYTSQVLVTKPQ
jgi:hypothetical protein